MMIVRTVLLVFFLGAIAHADVKIPLPDQEVLPNGLKVIWFVRDSLPVTDLNVTIRSGYRDEPEGKAGTAELLSVVLDRGSGGKTPQELGRTIEALGASRYSVASDDTISVGMHGLAPDAPVLLDLLAAMVTHPDFIPKEVEREHSRILDRWAHLPDYGEALAGVAYHRLVAAGTEYGRGSFLSIDEFKKVGREDLIAFYKSHFTPKNAVLMVVGRVDKEDFRKKILKALGDWKGEAPKRDRKIYTDSRLKGLLLSKGPRIVLVERPGLTQAQIKIGFKAPLLNVPEHYALSVGNALLGEYFNSRLNSLIRDKLGLAYGIQSSFSYSENLAKFTIESATRNESVGNLIQKTIDILKDLKAGGVSEEETRMAKDYLMGGYPLSVSTLGAIASHWLSGLILGLKPDHLNAYLPSISAVKREDILKAVSKYFDLDHLVIVVAGDGKGIEKGLSPAQRKTLKRLPSSALM